MTAKVFQFPGRPAGQRPAAAVLAERLSAAKTGPRDSRIEAAIADIADLFGPFMPIESADIAGYLRRTLPIRWSLDMPSADGYEQLEAAFGPRAAVQAVRRDRKLLAEWSTELEELTREVNVGEHILNGCESDRHAVDFAELEQHAWNRTRDQLHTAMLDYFTARPFGSGAPA